VALVAILLLLAAMICTGAVAFACIGLSAVRKMVSKGVGEDHNLVSSAIFTVGGTIYAVFLAFLVVAAWEANDGASANVAEEASLLTTLYRGSTAMDLQSGGKLRAVIRRYTQAVITDEWPIQARTGGAAETARKAGLDMIGVFGTMSADTRQRDAAIDQMQLSLISQLQADRNRRTLEAQESLSPVIWATAIICGFLVIVMSFFLYPDRDWPHAMMSSMLAVMVFMLIYVVYIFGKPFSGLAPLGPHAFEHSLEVYASVDKVLAASRG
jgi:hypothetical protein